MRKLRVHLRIVDVLHLRKANVRVIGTLLGVDPAQEADDEAEGEEAPRNHAEAPQLRAVLLDEAAHLSRHYPS